MRNPIRTTIIALTVLLLCPAFAGCQAGEPQPEISFPDRDDEICELTPELPIISFGGLPQPTAKRGEVVPLAASDSYARAYNALYQAMLAEKPDCSVSAYQLTKEQIGSLFSDVLNHSPELFYVYNRCGVSYNKTTGIVTKVSFTYTRSGDELTEAREEYRAAIAGILAELPEGMSPIDQLLWLHDYLCVRFAYDTDTTCYDPYTFLTEGKGVCQAYTLTYMALLKECGIEVDYASSSEMNHIWNQVKLDGIWYHVDVTWDDPIGKNRNDILGRVGHDNFLCSDSALIATGHYGWEGHECPDSRYDAPYLDTVHTAFAYLDGVWYTIDRQDGSLRTFDFATMTSVPLFSVDGVWYRWQGVGYYTYRYNNIVAYDHRLYYTTPLSICTYNPTDGSTRIFAEYTDGQGYLYAMHREGENLIGSVTTAPDQPAVDYFVCSLPPIGSTTVPEPKEYTCFEGLECGSAILSAKIVESPGEGASDICYILVANRVELAKHSDFVFEILYFGENPEPGEIPGNAEAPEPIRRYFADRETITFCMQIDDPVHYYRYSAAEGCCLFGLSVDGIPDGAYQSVELRLTDRESGEILYSELVSAPSDLPSPDPAE